MPSSASARRHQVVQVEALDVREVVVESAVEGQADGPHRAAQARRRVREQVLAGT